MNNSEANPVLDRAQGCLLGQFSGDSLGSLVEFMSPGKIRVQYPDGIKELQSGGTWNTIAGQPTDDSEMALALTRALLAKNTYDPEAARENYLDWLHSNPFDCGITTANGLSGIPIPESQANGALMRISPLGIFGIKFEPETVAGWAMQDAQLTHPNPVCQQTNALMAMAISRAIITGTQPQQLYEDIRTWAGELQVDKSLANVIELAAKAPPKDYIEHQGWVLIAFQNALWQLLHAPDLESAISDTILRGGDTDTNAAICGALLGAVYGRKGVPRQWEECILNCRPEKGAPGVYRPRPPEYWPTNILEFAGMLIEKEPQNASLEEIHTKN
jgi:ADP-ribosylglycohydrolase